jgi:hypothetical protein
MKMKIKSFLAKPYATYVYKQIKKSMSTAVADQDSIFNSLVKTASKTEFGVEHHFDKIKSHADFVKNVPLRTYEDFKVYIEKIKQGKQNILWKGFPIYFAKTSGTTSGDASNSFQLRSATQENHFSIGKLRIAGLRHVTQKGVSCRINMV